MNPDSTHEVPMKGNVSEGVVRVANTVRRPAMAWSASVDALLIHLGLVGFEGAPRPLGYDEKNRQVLTYVEGHADPDPSDLDVHRLVEVGRLIRRFHDAASSFVPSPQLVWNVAITPDSEELICHHDLAPWNLVRTRESMTIIDWDGAGPGSRLWDLAYAAHGFVPLSARAGLDDDVAAQRLAALVNGYGLDESQRARLLDMLGPRIWSMYELLRRGHESSTKPWSKLWSEGHGAEWLADRDFVNAKRDVWAKALGSGASSKGG